MVCLRSHFAAAVLLFDAAAIAQSMKGIYEQPSGKFLVRTRKTGYIGLFATFGEAKKAIGEEKGPQTIETTRKFRYVHNASTGRYHVRYLSQYVGSFKTESAAVKAACKASGLCVEDLRLQKCKTLPRESAAMRFRKLYTRFKDVSHGATLFSRRSSYTYLGSLVCVCVCALGTR